MINRDVIDRGKQQQFMQPVINLELYSLICQLSPYLTGKVTCRMFNFHSDS